MSTITYVWGSKVFVTIFDLSIWAKIEVVQHIFFLNIMQDYIYTLLTVCLYLDDLSALVNQGKNLHTIGTRIDSSNFFKFVFIHKAI